MISKFFASAMSTAVFFALPLSVAMSEGHADVPRQAALVGPPLHTPILAVAISGGRVIGVGAYGKILIGDATAIDAGRAAQVSSPIDVTLTSIVAAPGGRLITAGHEATVLRSEDNGDSWNIVTTDPNDPPILKLVRLQTGGFVGVGGNGLVLRSDDSGSSWQKQRLFVEEDGAEFDPHLFSLLQLSSGRLVATGESGFVFFSDDLGETWHSVVTGYNGPLFSGVQTGDSALVAFGMSGNVVHSSDGGISWVSGRCGTNDPVFSSMSADGEMVLAGMGGLFTAPSEHACVGLKQHADYQVTDFSRGPTGRYFLATSRGLKVISFKTE